MKFLTTLQIKFILHSATIIKPIPIKALQGWLIKPYSEGNESLWRRKWIAWREIQCLWYQMTTWYSQIENVWVGPITEKSTFCYNPGGKQKLLAVSRKILGFFSTIKISHMIRAISALKHWERLLEETKLWKFVGLGNDFSKVWKRHIIVGQTLSSASIILALNFFSDQIKY